MPKVTLIHLFTLLVAFAVLAGVVVAISSVSIGRCRITREAATRATLATTSAMIKNYELETGSYPPTLSVLVPKYLEKPPLDAWRRPLIYAQLTEGGFLIMSFGADGVPGGTDDNADIWTRYGPPSIVPVGTTSPTAPTRQGWTLTCDPGSR